MKKAKCTDCDGKGTRTLHGIAITEADRADWGEEEIAAYFDGTYDTKCETCDGAGTIDPEELRDRHEQTAMLRMEAPHLFM